MNRSQHIEFTKINLILVGAAISGLQLLDKNNSIFDSTAGSFLFLSGAVFAMGSIIYGYELLVNDISIIDGNSDENIDELLMVLTNLSAIVAFAMAFGIGIAEPRSKNGVILLMILPYSIIPVASHEMLDTQDRDDLILGINKGIIKALSLIFMMVLLIFVVFKINIPILDSLDLRL